MAEPKEKKGPRPDPRRERPDSLMIRCRPAWREFIDRLAEHDHAKSAGELVERAVGEYAARRGYPGPIPAR